MTKYRIEYVMNGQIHVWHYATLDDIITLSIELKCSEAKGDNDRILEIRQEPK